MGPAAKKRKLENSKVEEVVFDGAARQDYLTGFHKRKVQRTKQAQEAAARRAREERIIDRKKLREERKAEIERHVKEVNQLLHKAENGEGSEDTDSTSDESATQWAGLADPDPPPIDHEDEYIDEDKYTTVTVEAMDVTREGLFKAEQDASVEADEQKPTSGTANDAQLRGDSKAKKRIHEKKDKPKKKRKKFRYESKVDRKVSRLKERAKNSKQAMARRNG